MATKLFLVSTTASGTGLPATEQHTSFASDKNGDSQTINRTLSTVKGTSQTSINIITLNDVGTAEYYFSKFVSDTLNMSSISANTWTINLAAYSGHSALNFPNSGSGPLQVNVYVWRPSNGTKVGTIFQGGTSSVTEATTTERVKHATFSGSAVANMVSGDRIILELWAQFNSFIDLTVRFYFSGTTENTTPDASVSNHASFLETPQTLTFAGAGGGSLVSATSTHKYNVLTNAVQLVSATSTHKYHVAPKDGFTVFARMFVTNAINQQLYGRRSVVLSKLDNDQVDSAYAVHMDDDGTMYWFVRSLGRESWIKATGVVDPAMYNNYDFTNEDYSPSDYFTVENLPPLPDPIPYVDVAFTYAFEDRRMQIIKNGVLLSDTDRPAVPAGMVGRWPLREGSGTKAFNRVTNANNGSIVGATWGTLNNKTYLSFPGTTNNAVSILDYPEIHSFSQFTVSVWYWPITTPTLGNFDALIVKNWSLTGSLIFYIDNPAGTHRAVFGIKNDAGTVFSVVQNSPFAAGVNDRWYHVVIRWTKGGTTKVTVNNVTTTGAVTDPINLTTSADLVIGATSGITPHGYIRDVSIWDRELTNTEVTTLFNEGEAYPLTFGMVGHWLLNEGTDIGNTPVLPTDFLRTVRNSSRVAGAQDGTITNSTWVPLDQPHETYLSFDGNAESSQVAIPNYSTIQTFNGITISFWIYYRGLVPIVSNYLVSKNWASNGSFVLYVTSIGSLQFATKNDAGTTVTSTMVNPFPTVNTWYHVVAKWEAGTTVEVFVNNVKTTGLTQAGPLSTSTANLLISNINGTSNCLIYDLKLWNRKLTDLEVASIYNQGLAHSGFPLWHKDPDPPPDVPVPITNPFVEVYNVAAPSTLNQELVRLHAVIATGFDEKYNVPLGSQIAASTPPFATILDQPTTGGGGGGGTPNVDYDISHSASSHVEFESGVSRVAVQLDSGAASIGRVVTKVTFRGRRYGDASLGTVYCRIWKADGGIVDIGNTSATGWSSSDADQATFTNTGNTYACVQGDKIGFEISWTPDSNDSIETGQNTNAGNGYSAWQYDGAWGDAGNIDIAMKIESGSATGGTDVNIVWPAFNETCFGCPAGANGIRSYGMRVPSGSTLIGKKPTRVTFYLKKGVGTPTGNLICYIQRNGGATSVQFGLPLDVSTLTTTLTAKEFTDLGNGGDTGYALQVNDRIYFNYQSLNAANSLVTQRITGSTTGNAIETYYGDSDPAPTSTIMGWTNVSSNDACIKVEEGGFSSPLKEPWYELNNVNTKIGERIKATGSPLLNMKPTRVTVRLKAVGNPTGTIFCKLRDSGNVERASFGTKDASLISPEDFNDYTFTFIYQGFVMQDEWGIFLEYTGGTGADKILVNVKHQEVGPPVVDSAANTVLVIFSGAYTEVAADLSGKVFIGGSATDPAARLRVGEKVGLDTSALRGKKISRAEIHMKRTGLLATGSVFLRIRDPEEDAILATVGQIEGTSVSTVMGPHTMTKSPVSTVGIPTLGILTVEYEGGDDNNYIEVMTSKINAFEDTTKAFLVKYDDLLQQYETTFTAYDLVGKLEEGGDTFTPSAGEIPPPDPPIYNHDLMLFAGGYNWDREDSPLNWLNVVSNDVRIYHKILSLIELTNIFINRLDRSNIGYGNVARTGYFSMPENP